MLMMAKRLSVVSDRLVVGVLGTCRGSSLRGNSLTLVSPPQKSSRIR